jgi:PAS domain S-box-containing protein
MAKKILSETSNPKSKISKPQLLRALMVEDSEDDMLLIIRELKKGGYNPVYERVETATAMKKALQEKQWDIILCDYKLPKFSGEKAIGLLKETNIDIPLIIVSGTIGEETAVECMRSGAKDYIMKNKLSRLCPAIARELVDADSRSKRKQVEGELRESEGNFRHSLDNSPLGVRISTKEAETVYANQAALDIYGYDSIEEIKRIPVKERYTPQSYAEYRIRKKKREQGELGPSEYEISIVRKNGEVRHLLAFRKEILWNGVNKFQIIYQDITERKQTEEKLRENEKKYRDLYDFLPIPVYEMDFEANITSANRAIYETFRGTEEDLKEGFKGWQLLSPEEVDKSAKNIQRLLKGEQVKGTEYTLMRLDGSVFPAIVISSIIYSNGKPVRLRGAIIDITQRKQAEESLRRSEEKYRSLVENSQEGIFQSTAGGSHISVNQSFANILGYDSPEEVLATIADIPHQIYVHPDDRAKILQIIEKEGSVNGYEAEFYRKDGSKTWVSINMHAVRDEEGNLLYYQGINQDITEKKNMETERQQNIERLRKSLEATINAMAVTVETRDPYTAGHQRRVADLARSIAVEMKLKREQIDSIRMASAIHDIGKISLPTEILTKPTKLSDLEFSLIKTHSLSGYDILKDIEFPWPVADLVLKHHERMNGSGYPQGLKGENIPMEARILAVADVVEAITSHRPYRPALGIDFALEEIFQNRDILYDADVVDACLKLFREKGYTWILDRDS